MDRAGYVWGEDYGTVCWYHDEFTVECKPEIADKVAALAEESIAWAGRWYKIPVPHQGKATIGKNWAEIH
jgi:DNA polymerase I-like protein with 3'-5' exonuclease and polymerase domains